MEASELYDICHELATAQPGANATLRLHRLLVLACAEGCRREQRAGGQAGAFGNLFSQVDFLGKRLGMDGRQLRDLQTARRHSNTGLAVEAAEWPYDVMAVARLVSAVFQEPLPGSLLAVLPANERPHAPGLSIDKKYVRCIVGDFDDRYIKADTSDGPIVVDYANTDSGRDFSYLRKLLRAGMQLNLLDSSIDGGVVVPGQVIVEPDFLVDISSLAACFTSYGHHPLLYTLNRLKERANTQAILLGNFAGTALDDIITSSLKRSSDAPAASLSASLQRSFREQALQFCACADFDARQFRQQAAWQMENIRQAVEAMRPLLAASTPLLEPSFVCERLGLQGRVDLMTADMRLLVEQKSGRNMKIEHQSHDGHGMQLESHYVQLLLYYGVLRYNFDKSDRQVDTRLLYSRYPAEQGLLTVNYYRGLLREALQLRNQIVATELLIARDGFQRILPLLNVDVIYKGVARDAYFHRYVLPGLSALLAPLSALSPLEHAYYVRMLTFVYREQLAAKLGSAETRQHHAKGCGSDLWLMPLAEKEESGNIIASDKLPAGGQQGDDNDRQPVAAPNFRQGDMVYFYHYDKGASPDACKQILFKGSLLELGADRLVVAPNNAQQEPVVLKRGDDRPWAVEHGGSDTATGSAIRSLQRFITADTRRRALLLGQRPPEADRQRCLSRSYHRDYDEVLLHVCQARDYFLLVGPPGTGKTSMALKFIVEEELNSHALAGGSGQGEPLSKGGAILLMAYTNRAVDEICGMLTTLTSQEEGNVRFLRLGKPASCDPRYRRYLLDSALAHEGKLENARRLIAQTPVFVATTSMLLSQPWLLELKHFSMAIVDEASQILEPQIIGLLSHPAIDRFVLVGDHKQLPAVVQQSQQQSVVDEQVLHDICLDDCRQSLFERLLRWEHRQGRSQFVGVLHSHGRMHPEVALFPLQHFYQREQLHAVPLPHQQERSLNYQLPARDELDRLLMSRRLLFLPNEGDEVAEALLVADVLRRIRRFTATAFSPQQTVGVIVPYRRQIALIQQCLRNDGDLADITIDTVERYQGSQRDVIVYSFAITRRYQLDFLTATTFVDDDGTVVDRKLNVALTRARRQMVIVGRPDLLSRVALFRQMVEAYGQYQEVK